MKTKLSVLALASVALSVLPAVSEAQAQAPGERVPDHYIVRVQPGANAAGVAARHGVGPTFLYSTALNGFAGRIPPGLLRRLENDPQVVSVAPDRIVTATQSVNAKPGGGGGGGTTSGQIVPAGVTRIGAAPGNNLAFNGTGVGVAIVDTGIDFNHADLAANVSSVSYSAYGPAGQDDQGHGTHVAGIVAAVHNSIGVVGVAPGAKLYGVKVLDSTGTGSDAVVIAGLDWVAANASTVVPSIRVVNMSLGRPAAPGSIEDSTFQAAIDQVVASGITVVVSAGNDAGTEISDQVPSGFPNVIAVASTTAKTGVAGKVGRQTYQVTVDTASYFTTDGAGVAISAPGEDQENVKNGGFLASVGILSTALGGSTTRLSGTSMAAPHVAGVVALLWEQALAAGSILAPEDALRKIQGGAAGPGSFPKDSLTTSYSFDGVREGVLSAPGALAAP